MLPAITLSAISLDSNSRYQTSVIIDTRLSAYGTLPVDALDGSTVLSTGDYHPSRDGRINDLDSGALSTAEYERALLPGAAIGRPFPPTAFM